MMHAPLVALVAIALAAVAARLPSPPRAAQDHAPPARARPPADAPNFVLVTMDTTRADHLGCYGYPRPTTPNIDRLAAESVVFENCHSTVTITTPSHTSILTGTWPFEHGVTNFAFNSDREKTEARRFEPIDRLRTITQHLADQGWRTGGFVTAATTKKSTGLAVGFDSWTEPDEPVRFGAEATRDALEWLATVEPPFFLWLHYFDPHKPPREQNQQYVDTFAGDAALRALLAERGIRKEGKGATNLEKQVAWYDAGLRRIDDCFGDLRTRLEQRGFWPRTTVLIVGDHGEGLAQHDVMSHGPVWREGTHVPFVLRLPGVAPERVPTLVSTIDAVATAVANTPGLPGEAFLAQASGKNVLAADFEPRAVFTMSPARRGDYSIHVGRWHLIRLQDGTRSLFDVERDPHELDDLAEKEPQIANVLERQLLQMVQEHRSRHVELYGEVDGKTGPDAAELRRQIEELAKLGYTEEGGDDLLPDADDGDGESGDDADGGKTGDDDGASR
ncbi:MAG: sulfatase [Planctomycetes bacterium]|nr:sulfatase [Planctomycetota bacterium]